MREGVERVWGPKRGRKRPKDGRWKRQTMKRGESTIDERRWDEAGVEEVRRMLEEESMDDEPVR